MITEQIVFKRRHYLTRKGIRRKILKEREDSKLRKECYIERIELVRVAKKRKILNFVPKWNASVEGYVINQIRKHAWRMRNRYTSEDLYQEAYLVFDRVKKRYPYIREPQHFMSLFKTSLYNTFVDLMNKTRRIPVFSCELIDDEEQGSFENTLEAHSFCESDVELMLQMQDAPALLIPIFQHFCDVNEIKSLLLLRDDQEELHVAKKPRENSKAIRKHKITLQGNELFWEIIRRYICKMKKQDYLSPDSFQIPVSVQKRINIKQILMQWYNGDQSSK